MRSARFSTEAGTILQEVIADYAARSNPPAGLILGLDMIRRGLANIAQLTIDLHESGCADIRPILLELQSLHAVRLRGNMTVIK